MSITALFQQLEVKVTQSPHWWTADKMWHVMDAVHLKKEGDSDRCYSIDGSLRHVKWNKQVLQHKCCIILFLCGTWNSEIQRLKIGRWLPRTMRRGGWAITVWCVQSSFWEMWRVWWMDGGDVSTTMYLMPQNCTLKNG